MPEPRAITMAAFIASLTLAALALWLAPRSRYARALHGWAAGGVLASGGALLNVSQGLVADELALVIGNPLMVAGLGLLIDGAHRLSGRSTHPLWWLLPALGLACSSIWWGLWQPNLANRVMIFTPVVVWLMACMLVALWPLRTRGIGVGLVFVTTAALCMSLIMLVRAWWAWKGYIQPVYRLDTTFNMVLYLLAAMAFGAIQTGLLLVHQLLLIADLRDQAECDPLTGLLNRHALASRLPLSLAGWALVAVDVDHFKQVNDTHGHAVGDQVLACVGQVLQRQLRAGDVAVRMGGEEFAVLLHHTQATDAHTVAERLRGDVQRLVLQRTGIPATASLGVAMGKAQEDFSALWARADAALYTAKTQGRNRVALALQPEAAAL